MTATIHIVTDKDVIEVFNIFLFAVEVRRTVELEKCHQISILPVNISEYFERRPYSEHRWLLSQYVLNYVAQSDYMLWIHSEFDLVDVTIVLWLQEVV
jgi:hypothetical protein